MIIAAHVAVLACAAGAQSTCQMVGAPWVPQGKSGLAFGLYVHDQWLCSTCRLTVALHRYPATTTGAESFNMSFRIRHGATGGVGEYLPGNQVNFTVMQGNRSLQDCIGTFSSSCNNITWTVNGTASNKCFGYNWCRAWTTGCDSPAPPYDCLSSLKGDSLAEVEMGLF